MAGEFDDQSLSSLTTGFASQEEEKRSNSLRRSLIAKAEDEELHVRHAEKRKKNVEEESELLAIDEAVQALASNASQAAIALKDFFNAVCKLKALGGIGASLTGSTFKGLSYRLQELKNAEKATQKLLDTLFKTNDDQWPEFLNDPRIHSGLIIILRIIDAFFVRIFNIKRNKPAPWRNKSVNLIEEFGQDRLRAFHEKLSESIREITPEVEALQASLVPAHEVQKKIVQANYPENLKEEVARLRHKNAFCREILKVCCTNYSGANLIAIDNSYFQERELEPSYRRMFLEQGVQIPAQVFYLKLDYLRQKQIEAELNAHSNSEEGLPGRLAKSAYQQVTSIEKLEPAYQAVSVFRGRVTSDSVAAFMFALVDGLPIGYGSALEAFEEAFKVNEPALKGKAFSWFLQKYTTFPAGTSSTVVFGLCACLSRDAKADLVIQTPLSQVLMHPYNFSSDVPDKKIIDLVLEGLKWNSEPVTAWEKVKILIESLKGAVASEDKLTKLGELRQLFDSLGEQEDRLQAKAKQVLLERLSLGERIAETKRFLEEEFQSRLASCQTLKALKEFQPDAPLLANYPAVFVTDEQEFVWLTNKMAEEREGELIGRNKAIAEKTLQLTKKRRAELVEALFVSKLSFDERIKSLRAVAECLGSEELGALVDKLFDEKALPIMFDKAVDSIIQSEGGLVELLKEFQRTESVSNMMNNQLGTHWTCAKGVLSSVDALINKKLTVLAAVKTGGEKKVREHLQAKFRDMTFSDAVEIFPALKGTIMWLGMTETAVTLMKAKLESISLPDLLMASSMDADIFKHLKLPKLEPIPVLNPAFSRECLFAIVKNAVRLMGAETPLAKHLLDLHLEHLKNCFRTILTPVDSVFLAGLSRLQPAVMYLRNALIAAYDVDELEDAHKRLLREVVCDISAHVKQSAGILGTGKSLPYIQQALEGLRESREPYAKRSISAIAELAISLSVEAKQEKDLIPELSEEERLQVVLAPFEKKVNLSKLECMGMVHPYVLHGFNAEGYQTHFNGRAFLVACNNYKLQLIALVGAELEHTSPGCGGVAAVMARQDENDKDKLRAKRRVNSYAFSFEDEVMLPVLRKLVEGEGRAKLRDFLAKEKIENESEAWRYLDGLAKKEASRWVQDAKFTKQELGLLASILKYYQREIAGGAIAEPEVPVSASMRP